MSTNLKYYNLPDFKSWLEDAVSNATSEQEVKFSNDMQDRFDRYGENMFVSEPQINWIKRIGGNE
jgi:hypothetical protein